MTPDVLWKEKPRVLIVDDEPINVQVLAEALGELCDVRFTTVASEVHELVSKMAFDLVLLDLVMPGRTGFEVLTDLRADPVCADVPVIFVTAMSELDDEEAGLNAGAVDYITKPISPAIVRARVRTHVELKRQRDALNRLAETDGLTGIANRRRFDRELDRMWRTCQRRNEAFCLMLADVDFFKLYNDHFGHGPGDHCLREVGQALARAAYRSEDVVARYGGEEFAILCPADESQVQARRVLDAVREIGLPHPRSTASPTVSLSMGALEVAPRSGIDMGDALAAADALLYQAKRAGRARAHWRRFDDDTVITLRLEDSP
ncbi:MAG: diguanylate cyclase [Xanthomonadales bacterium]|nr:diguanylate cyclase [Xanthomonadales bacterium]